MRITIFGAGAVGGQMGARLMRAGIPVSLIARGNHLAAMKTRGLTLVEGADEWTCRPACTDDPAELGAQDVLVVTVKTPSLGAVVAQMEPLLARHTHVVFAMNGVPWWFPDGLPCPVSAELHESLDPGGAMRKTVGPERTIGCSINSGSEIVAPGVVRSDTPERNRIIIGKPDGTMPEVLAELGALLQRAGYPTVVTSRIRDEMWPKIMTNSSRPPICGLADITTRQLADDRDLLAIVERMLHELTALGTCLGLSFSFDIPHELARRPRGDHVSSFVQDLQAGRRPEATTGILALRALARAAGVDTPMLDAVGALIAARVSSLESAHPGHTAA